MTWQHLELPPPSAHSCPTSLPSHLSHPFLPFQAATLQVTLPRMMTGISCAQYVPMLGTSDLSSSGTSFKHQPEPAQLWGCGGPCGPSREQGCPQGLQGRRMEAMLRAGDEPLAALPMGLQPSRADLDTRQPGGCSCVPAPGQFGYSSCELHASHRSRDEAASPTLHPTWGPMLGNSTPGHQVPWRASPVQCCTPAQAVALPAYPQLILGAVPGHAGSYWGRMCLMSRGISKD